jgi:hypothetical protein
MKRVAIGCCLGLSLVASGGHAADVESGKRLAQQRCAACHIVTADPRNDVVADAPPFLAIGRKYGFDSEALVFNLVGPHAKMNFALTRPEANDVAAYIQSLARWLTATPRQVGRGDTGWRISPVERVIFCLQHVVVLPCPESRDAPSPVMPYATVMVYVDADAAPEQRVRLAAGVTDKFNATLIGLSALASGRSSWARGCRPRT